MISILAFILECVATAALVGTVAGVAVLAVLGALRTPLRRLGPGARGDIYLLAGLLPAMAAISALAAAAAPSLGAALGLGPDHCPGHGHHFHICFLHFSGLRPALATLGAFALITWVFRTAVLVHGVVVTSKRSSRLERLGDRRQLAFPVMLLPGIRLCHATGLVRRRILLSSEIEDALSPGELDGALAHEEAHLRRRDPMAGFLLAVAALFVPPPVGAWIRRQHREASEEVCDGAAAMAVGDGVTVASALIKVADLQRRAGSSAIAEMAFGEHQLEARVNRLLAGGRFPAASSRWCLLALATTAGFALVTTANAEALHHAAETLLGQIF